jgi:hypothetical protein
MQRPFMVYGGSNGPGLSSVFGEVDGGGLLHPQLSLVSMLFSHLAIEGYLLTGKLIMRLNHPQLSVDLSSMDSCLLLILIGLLLDMGVLHPWLECRVP